MKKSSQPIMFFLACMRRRSTTVILETTVRTHIIIIKDGPRSGTGFDGAESMLMGVRWYNDWKISWYIEGGSECTRNGSLNVH
jgi:hypothetical protein